ncbi:arginase family protein [Nonomuraea sp. NPDC050451]|uniref:arginase family protein n=1 Tax=Nonomuraea sp. NPDC050451 TaxID=3364364 RepID=UPI0037ADC6F2
MSHAATSRSRGDHLRLVWPQWQGAGAAVVKELAPEFPHDVARRGYTVGTKVLEAVLPPHDGPTAAVPVTLSDDGLEERDGVEAKTVILKQLANALETIRDHDPARITTLGGECAVSVAPFTELARRYGDDLAVIWIDSHPDIGTPDSAYKGYHAMAAATRAMAALRTSARAAHEAMRCLVTMWKAANLSSEGMPSGLSCGVKSFSRCHHPMCGSVRYPLSCGRAKSSA